MWLFRFINFCFLCSALKSDRVVVAYMQICSILVEMALHGIATAVGLDLGD